MPPHRVYTYRNRGKPAPPPPVDPLNENISYAKFWATFQVLTQAMNAQGNQPTVVPIQKNGNLAVARVRYFIRMNPPKFFGLKVHKDL